MPSPLTVPAKLEGLQASYTVAVGNATVCIAVEVVVVVKTGVVVVKLMLVETTVSCSG